MEAHVVMTCPGCRSSRVRRRKRKTLALLLASLKGKWPYKCGVCGMEFMLEKRNHRHSRDIYETPDPPNGSTDNAG
jgi:hypothetical protein